MRLKIGLSEYDLIKHKFDSELLGLCDYVTGTITVDNTQCPQTIQRTLFHEIAHAILYELGKNELNEDEVFVDLLGAQICHFIKNNDLQKINKFLGCD